MHFIFFNKLYVTLFPFNIFTSKTAKNMQKIFMSFAILLIAATNTHAQSQPTNIIRIIDGRNFKDPVVNWKNKDDVATYYADLARHKHHEVNVYALRILRVVDLVIR